MSNFKCLSCGNLEMRCVFPWDDAQRTDIAFNVYACDTCGTLAKESVWHKRDDGTYRQYWMTPIDMDNQGSDKLQEWKVIYEKESPYIYD